MRLACMCCCSRYVWGSLFWSHAVVQHVLWILVMVVLTRDCQQVPTSWVSALRYAVILSTRAFITWIYCRVHFFQNPIFHHPHFCFLSIVSLNAAQRKLQFFLKMNRTSYYYLPVFVLRKSWIVSQAINTNHLLLFFVAREWMPLDFGLKFCFSSSHPTNIRLVVY